MTRCLFDTSSLQQLARLKHKNPEDPDIAQFNDFVTEAMVPLLSMMEVVRSSHLSYQYGKRVPTTPERAVLQASLARIVVEWCNGHYLAPSLNEYGILRWPLNAKIQMVPIFGKALGSVIEDLADARNVRCTQQDGCYIVASSVDHMILASARQLRATLVTEDRHLAAAADHLGLPYRKVQDQPDLAHLWSDCSKNKICIRGVVPNRQNELANLCGQADPPR